MLPSQVQLGLVARGAQLFCPRGRNSPAVRMLFSGIKRKIIGLKKLELFVNSTTILKQQALEIRTCRTTVLYNITL